MIEWCVQHQGYLHELCVQAGEAIMEIYKSDFQVSYKQDHHPVTKADQLSEAIIIKGLQAIAPNIPIIAEESFSSKPPNQPITDRYFWLVDPLDGTKEFLCRNGEFSVNIGLIEDNKTIMGMIYAPATQTLYYGVKTKGAWKQQIGQDIRYHSIRCNAFVEDGLVMVASRRHGDLDHSNPLFFNIKVKDRVDMGSSLKFCLIAEGKADFYPRIGRTMEWDTAAGQAILEAAGGSVTDMQGQPFTYRKNSTFDNPSFVAWHHAINP